MFLKYLFISVATVLYTLLFFNEANRQQQREKLKVVVITVESLRHDMVNPENSPQLLKAAEQATRFINHRAISGWTGTNIVSLMTGLTPFESGVHTRGQSVAPDLQLPLEQLEEKGYKVSGLQPFMAMELYKNLGLNISESEPDPLHWLAKQKIRNIPYFFWYHYVDTHLPYTQEDTDPLSHQVLDENLKKIATQFSIHFDEVSYTDDDIDRIHQLQKHNLREFDRWFGEFWSLFTRGGFLRDTILIVTADHGDEHGERGMVGHASTTLSGHLHEEIVRIPLFIWLPNIAKVGNTVSSKNTTSSHPDIMVTLLDLLGISPEIVLTGQNLFSTDRKEEWTGMTSSGGFSEPDPLQMRWFEYSYLKEHWKSRVRIYNNGKEDFYLFNLNSDPKELENLYTTYPEVTTSHKKFLLPLISDRTLRPIAAQVENSALSTQTPRWLVPATSGTYTYDNLKENFSLHWSGSKEKSYILEYRAGLGSKMIAGHLEIEGNLKTFSNIERRYWETWIVPQSPYRLRIKEVHGDWSEWISVEAQP